MLADGAETDAGGEGRGGGEQLAGVEAGAVIADDEDQAAGKDPEGAIDAGGVGMLREIEKSLLRGAVGEDLQLETGLAREGIHAKRSVEALRNAAELPELAEGVGKAEALPLGRLEPVGERADLSEGVGDQAGDAFEGLTDGAGRIGELHFDGFDLEADGGERLADAGMEIAAEALALQLKLMDGAAGEAALAHAAGKRPLSLREPEVTLKKSAL